MMINKLICLFGFFILFSSVFIPKQSSIQKFESHYNRLVVKCSDQYGKTNTPMWLSMWNLETQKYPFDFSRSDSIPCRVYLNRSVDAPGGSTLYWDLPDVAAAVDIARQTGNKKLEVAAKSYVKSYLENNTAKNGIILWGNHYYYDVLMDTTVKFKGSEKPTPVSFQTETGNLHEMRPILPPWELLYQWHPLRIEDHIREAAKLHIVDSETGEFNRHANNKSEYAFLESGSILVNSLAFLYSKTDDTKLLDLAESILEYSFSNRNPETGLVINSPSRDRWDQHTSTTEIGLWGSNILKSLKYLPVNKRTEWVGIVKQAIQPWLVRGFNSEIGLFYGALNVTNANPIARTDEYPYKPETYADVWNPLFPTHNYPLPFAECCLELYKITKNQFYKEAAENWYSHILNQLENRFNYTLYAENYARIIHYLFHYGNELNKPEALEIAKLLKDEAISNLYVIEKKMFRSHTNELRYDAVDGIGLMYFALSWAEGKKKTDLSGSFF